MNSHLSALLKSALLIPAEERDLILALASSSEGVKGLKEGAKRLERILSRIVEEVDRAAEEDPGLLEGLVSGGPFPAGEGRVPSNWRGKQQDGLFFWRSSSRH